MLLENIGTSILVSENQVFSTLKILHLTIVLFVIWNLDDEIC